MDLHCLSRAGLQPLRALCLAPHLGKDWGCFLRPPYERLHPSLFRYACSQLSRQRSFLQVTHWALAGVKALALTALRAVCRLTPSQLPDYVGQLGRFCDLAHGVPHYTALPGARHGSLLAAQ